MTNIDISDRLLLYQCLVSILVDWLTTGTDPIPVQRHYAVVPVNFIIRLTTDNTDVLKLKP